MPVEDACQDGSRIKKTRHFFLCAVVIALSVFSSLFRVAAYWEPL